MFVAQLSSSHQYEPLLDRDKTPTMPTRLQYITYKYVCDMCSALYMDEYDCLLHEREHARDEVEMARQRDAIIQRRRAHTNDVDVQKVSSAMRTQPTPVKRAGASRPTRSKQLAGRQESDDSTTVASSTSHTPVLYGRQPADTTGAVRDSPLFNDVHHTSPTSTQDDMKPAITLHDDNAHTRTRRSQQSSDTQLHDDDGRAPRTRRMYVCGMCTDEFKFARHYRHHMFTVHEVVVPIKCKQCDVEFTRPENLSRHMKYQHGNNELFTCEHCAKTFKRKDVLKSHWKICEVALNARKTSIVIGIGRV